VKEEKESPFVRSVPIGKKEEKTVSDIPNSYINVLLKGI
jgi:hypothetical protein